MMMELAPMPPISEDCSSQGESDNGDEGDSNFEQLMVSMLEERDKLQENLRESQELLQQTLNRLQDIEKERNLLTEQLNLKYSKDYIQLNKELQQLKEALVERDEEINELKSERNNTRLLLEHLETLVSRHEKSLRMTVVKRQQSQSSSNTSSSSSGVSSEAEVLKALKSLFEHHKALDERYRERYKLTIEKCNSLEIELEKCKNELKIERESIARQLTTFNLIDENINETNNNNDENNDNDVNKINKKNNNKEQLQLVLDKQNKELTESLFKINELQLKLKELDDKLKQSDEKCFNLTKELLISQELNKKYQRDLKELQAQKDDQEQRIQTLEQRYINTQRECSSLHDLNSRLEADLAIRDNSFKTLEDRFKNLQAKLDASELKYEQLIKKNDNTSSNNNSNNLNDDSLTKNLLIAQFQEKNLNNEEKLINLQCELENAKTELTRSRQREKMSEDHNIRLTQTIDKLLSESNERLQLHLKEKMQSLDEKNNLIQELDKLRKDNEFYDNDRIKLNYDLNTLRQELNTLRKENQNLNLKLKEINLNYLYKINTFKQQQQQQQQIAATSSSSNVLINICDDFEYNNNNNNNNTDWDKLEEAANVIANVQNAFDLSCSNNNEDNIDINIDDDDNIDVNKQQQQHTDAQTIALLLQKQLDEIDNEIRLIKEEKQNTELRAEELESKCVQQQQIGDITTTTTTKRSISPITLNTTNGGSGRSTPQQLRKEYSLNLNQLQQQQQQQQLNRPSISLRNHHQQSSIYSTNRYNTINHQQQNDINNHNSSPLSSSNDSLQQIYPYNNNNDINSLNSFQSINQTTTSTGTSSTNKKGFKTALYRLFSQRKTRNNHNKDGLIDNNKIFNSFSSGELEIQGGTTASSAAAATTTNNHNQNYDVMCCLTESDKKYKTKLELLEEAIRSGLPFQSWNGPTIVAWLELWVGMPAWYVAACRANVKSGSIMSALSDAEIHREIGISNPLHRLKLRLAIQEMVNLTSPSSALKTSTLNNTNVSLLISQSSAISLAFGEMNHEWIGKVWLTHLGLSQYKSSFMECLIDARMLDHLNKKDLRGQLKMIDSFHRNSFQYGILVLKRLNYDKNEFLRRQYECDNSLNSNKDLLLWSNERIIKWLINIGLKEYTRNLQTSGLHGGVFIYEDNFDYNSLALLLEIPNNDVQSRLVLQNEFNALLSVNTEKNINNSNNNSNKT